MTAISAIPMVRAAHAGLARAYWAATIVLLALALAMVCAYAPIDADLGPSQRILYLHLPAAINTYLAALVVFIASLGYVWNRRPAWDRAAHATAVVTVLNGTVVLVTGMVWARQAWGHWWLWSPRLTFSLILCLLYIAYLALRRAFPPASRSATVGAVYGVMAFLDVPLVYLSVKLLPDIHPTSSTLTAPMVHTLAVWMVAVTMLSAGIALSRYSLLRLAGAGVDPAPRRAPTPEIHA